ncbi:MAG: hypothetical protein H7Z72_23135 [Bacteroidetes bacterium]|nr:hypothetical protein [Fibrella sp.]
MIDLFSRKASIRIVLLLQLATVGAWAQQSPMTGAPAGTGDKVDLIHADSLNIVNQPNAVIYRLINNVKLQQKGLVLYCDIAIQNKTTNVIEAYGNVRMVQGDTITVRGDTLYYYGNNRQANVLGNVVLKDRKMTLSTARLVYDMLSGVAHYPVRGRIVDRENILTSDEGYYDTRSKQFTFQRNVRLLNQPPGKEKTTILADSLLYNSLSKIADFQGPTRIISKDGTLIARNGQYNTTTRVSNFRQRATAETDKYILTGDSLNFDNINEVGVADGNVVIVNKADKTTLTGDHGRYNGKAGVSRMIGHAVVRSPISQGPDRDTLYMRADTLFSFDNKVTKRKKLVGQRNVLVFKSDLQSKCDSLVYDVTDSLLYFYKKPIVWSQNYQMEADSITAKLKNNRINTMFLKSRAFVISQDTLLNFNQVKGRQITAFFRTILAPVKKTPKPAGPMTASSVNRPALTPVVTTTTAAAETTTLDRVLVEGNGQTIYFAVDDKSRLIGMNRTECSKMNIEFTNSQVTQIRNYGRPDMYLTPPKELTNEKKQLDGFRWREKEKPTKAQTLGLTLAEPKPAAPQNVVDLLRDKISTTTGEVTKPVAVSVTSKPTLPSPVLPGVAKPTPAKPTEPVPATTPPVVKSGKPLAGKPTVLVKAIEPVTVRPISKSTTGKLTETLTSEALKSRVTNKRTELAKPAAVSSSKSKSTAPPTRRQQRAANRLTPAVRRKTMQALPAHTESDLEKGLNQRPRKQ